MTPWLTLILLAVTRVQCSSTGGDKRFLRVPSLKDPKRERLSASLFRDEESLRILYQEEEEFWTRNYEIFSTSLAVTPTVAPTAAPPPLIAPTAPPPPPPPTTCRSLLWSDEFASSSLNESVWSYDLGTGVDGWGNLELQSYARENVFLQNGNLVISVQEKFSNNGTRSFTSGRIRTQDTVEVLYGDVEARIRIPANLSNGLWPAFWTLGGNHREAGWPAAGEIDIMEMGSAGAIADNAVHRRVTSVTHWDFNGDRATFVQQYNAPSDLNDGQFHIFRMNWNSTHITTYVDDAVILEFSISHDFCDDCSEFHQPHFIILNVAVGGTFTGILEEAGVTAPLPAEMMVDYVRICDNGETVLTGSTAEEIIEYGFDCGLPDRCTTSALNNYALDAKCGDRIQSLIGSGLPESQACEQVASTDFPEYCGSCWEDPVDCSVPETCTLEVLNSDAGGFSCGSRIEFLISQGQPELEACRAIALSEFPTECGPCAPPAETIDCGVPESCTEDALSTDADGVPCVDRISFLINSQGQSQLSACEQVAVSEFPVQCGACAPAPLTVDCGVPETCTRAVLGADAGGFSCNERIDFIMTTSGETETDACNQIAVVEFPLECGGCNPNLKR